MYKPTKQNVNDTEYNDHYNIMRTQGLKAWPPTVPGMKENMFRMNRDLLQCEIDVCIYATECMTSQ